MPILEDKKLIFIHIPKCAGTSIVDSLGMTMKGHYTCHYYVAQQPKHPKIEDKSYTSFTIVRNPWDRLVSAYEYCKMGSGNFYNHMHDDYEYLKGKSFEYTISLLEDEPYRFIHPSWYLQTYWIASSEAILVDKIFKFENLDPLTEFLASKGITTPIQKLNSSKRDLDYRTYYTDKLVEKVAKIYACDIENLNYSYDKT